MDEPTHARSISGRPTEAGPSKARSKVPNTYEESKMKLQIILATKGILDVPTMRHISQAQIRNIH